MLSRTVGYGIHKDSLAVKNLHNSQKRTKGDSALLNFVINNVHKALFVVYSFSPKMGSCLINLIQFRSLH
jgi:hypothetical protein